MPMLGYPPIDGTIYTALDSVAQCPLGTRYTYPLNPAAAIGSTPYKGLGAPQTVCYVQYLATAASNFVAQPGTVYWVDESYTSVTGLYSESAFGLNGAAGWILINTTNYPGSLTGAQLLAAVKGNYCWIVTGGFIPGCYSAGSVAAGEWLIGSTTAFQPARVTAGNAPTYPVFGQAATAVSMATLSDVLVSGFGPFNW